MSLFDCLNRAMNDTEGDDAVRADRARGERAQKEWRERADRYERDGHPRHTAEVLAAEDVKEAFRREAGEKRHVYLSVMAQQRKAQAHVTNAAEPDMVRRMEKMDYKHRGMVRYFNGRMGEYLRKHHRNLIGDITNPAEQAHLADELHGVSTGNQNARALAEGIQAALEDLRIAFNEAGGMIPKLDNWGLPHIHDRLAVRRAGFDGWFKAIDGRLDWDRITDPLTGRPIQKDATGTVPEAFRRTYLKSAYDNIVFGSDASEAVYGRPEGVATYRKHLDQRHLHFKAGADWMAYNKDFGTGGLHQSLMGHVHRMSRDIVLMREFGPNPKLGAEYEAALWRKKAKDAGDDSMLPPIAQDNSVALRMLNVMSGGNVPQSGTEQWISRAMSSARQVMTSAFLDRAIIASLSDTNTMRMAAQSMGMNQTNIIQRQLGVLQGLSKDELLRAGWIADTMADAGSALARFQQEVAPAEWAERVSQMSMRVQGLSAWTDRARATAYTEFGGFMASQADLPLSQLNPGLTKLFRKWGVTEADWADFRAEGMFTADNGATFLLPLHFRNNSKLPRAKADDLFFKMQGASEEFMELAVPTKSLLAQAWTDPAANNLPPGSLGYEMLKSATAFKSFTFTFSINQYRQIMAQGGFASKNGILYGLNLAAGATVMGALALQVNELLMGRDPQDMTNPGFWARALAKGGGAGIVGDIVTTGETSWGGGFQAWAAGPVWALANDAWALGPSNAIDALGDILKGEEIDTNFAAELSRMGRRYTPMGQTPAIGPALDRLFWDQLQLLLDPESGDALAAAAKRRDGKVGGGTFWMPGSPVPDRAPNLGNALGQ